MTGRRILAGLLLILGFARAGAQAPVLEHFTVTVEGEPLALWARRAQHPKGAILLLHGRTWSALPDFDLQVPGESRSVLAALAARGYAAYALDLRGYGASPRDATGWLTPKRAAADVEAVLAWITANQPLGVRPVLLGWSNGSLVAQLVAQQHPEQISGVILYGYAADPDERFSNDGELPKPSRVRNTPDDARSDFISPQVTSPRMVAAYVAAALQADPVRADWHLLDQWNALNPTRIVVPTLLLSGERDPGTPPELLTRLFNRLGAADRKSVVLLGGDHAALLEDTRPTFIDAVVRFIERRP